MNLAVFFRVLQARWLTIAGFTVFALIAAVAITLVTPRSFTATTELIIDGKGQDPISGQTIPAQMLSGYIATQAEIITSRNVANKVIDLENLVDNPYLIREYRSASGTANPPSRPWLLHYLGQGITAEPNRGSNVMSVSFTSEDPQLAARLADAYAQAYIQTNLDLRIEPAKQITQWYDLQLTSLRKSLVDAKDKLSTYQEEHSIIASDDRIDLETSKLNELSSMLVAAQGQRLDSQSRSNQLSTSKGVLPAEVLDNPQVQKLSTDLAQAQATLNELGTQVGSNHPQYKQAKREVDAIQSQLNKAVKQVSGSLRSTVELSKAQEKQLQEEVNAQKERVLQLNRSRNELALLRQEADNAQAAYDAALARSTQTKLESQSALTDVAILNAAAVPSRPTAPKPAINIVLGLALGLLLGTAIALIWEWMDRRVRSAGELETRLGIPVLAYIPAENKRWGKGRRAV